MRATSTFLASLLLAWAAAPPAAASFSGVALGGDRPCPSADEPTHLYVASGGGVATSAHAGAVGGGAAVVSDRNAPDCDGNGVPDDFDGDYEFGVGGAYFGIAGNEQVNAECGLGLRLHRGASVTVWDVSAPSVALAAGYEGWDEGAEPYCAKDGVIGDDPADCLRHHRGAAPADPCADAPRGVNLDAGVWVFLLCVAGDAPEAGCATMGVARIG